MRDLLQWVGGSISRVAGTAFVVAIFMIIFGLTPAQALAGWLVALPEWMESGWFKLGLLIVGIALGIAAVRYNVWSRKQVVIDQLAEEISWASQHLMNRQVSNDPEYDEWERIYKAWDARVLAILGNRAFFTRADQVHFEALGVAPKPFVSPYDASIGRLFERLSLKFERLRDIIRWTQGSMR